MEKLIIYAVVSYLIGSMNPAAVFGRIKNKDLRRAGTGNLGATNAHLVLGRAYGAAVMLIDMGKGFICTRLGASVSAITPASGMITGTFAVVGHIFPFYMGFRGGKGLAAFGGMVLAFDPYIFAILLPVCIGLMLLTDRAVTMPYAGAVLFPIACAAFGYGIRCTLFAAAAGALVAARNFGNLKKAAEGRDTRIREYLKGTKPPNRF
ncbi:MAG: glycerol-3-phosphate acyltransferase [Clostridia bacterium]|nr:glycerol-3-phosphate acyltransferase [Clostridia bacterium]